MTVSDSEPLLIKAVGAEIATALGALTPSNTGLTLVTTPRYQSAPASDKGKAYVIYDINDTVDHHQTVDRVWNDHLAVVTAWSPDPSATAEMMKAIVERLTAINAAGQAANVSLTGFAVQAPLRQFNRTVLDEGTPGLTKYYGKSLGVVFITRPD